METPLDPRAIGKFTIIQPEFIPGWITRQNTYEGTSYSNPDNWWIEKVQPILNPLIEIMKDRHPSPDYTNLPDGRVHVHIHRPGIDVEFYARWQ